MEKYAPGCEHMCSGNCRRVGCNCECGEWHGKFEDDEGLDFTQDNLADALGRPDLKELFDSVDNGTTHITIATPEDWKCERENCKVDYLHKHGTFPSLKKHD